MTAPYSLQSRNGKSYLYYEEVRTLADEVIQKASSGIIPITKKYISYLKEYKLEEIRAEEEYILELLSFGILWRAYAGRALAARTAPYITLSKMSEWRKKHQKYKPVIDFTRGILFTLFLLPVKARELPSRAPSFEDIDHVCKWFEATGEFREQALRFVRWRAWWTILEPEELNRIFLTIREFATWFISRSEEVLGKYTNNVDRFLIESEGRYLWKEDRIQCTRSRSEYHLNMAGAELMNRAFRTEYLDTEKKILLVPGCMRVHNNDECKGKKVKEGLKCTDCTPRCNVNRLKHMGQKFNFDVYIIPHASDLSLWAPKPGRAKAGIIASACMTQLVEGGWELKRYGVPAQCVPLDCSGCKKHWHSKGIPTKFNLKELKRILSPSIG